MANILTWGIILIANFLSILLGLFSAFKFFRAFLDNRDLMKYTGYLVTAFLLILVFPVITTLVGVKIAPFSGKYALVGISVQTSDLRSKYGAIEMPSTRIYFKEDEERIINLKIDNEFEEPKTLTVDISCEGICDEALDMVVPSEEYFIVEPMVIFELPINVNIRDDVPPGKYNFTLTLKNQDGSLYDYVQLKISVGE